MRDLEKLDEPMSLSPSEWGELLPFAYEFGVADEAVSFHGAPQPAVWQTWYETKSPNRVGARAAPCCGPGDQRVFERLASGGAYRDREARGGPGDGGGFGRK